MSGQIKISDAAVEARNLRTVLAPEVSAQNQRAMRVLAIAGWGDFPQHDADPKFWQSFQSSARKRGVKDTDIYSLRYMLDRPILEAPLLFENIELTRKDKAAEGEKVKFVLSPSTRPIFYSMQDVEGKHHPIIQTRIPLRIELQTADGGHWVNPATHKLVVFDLSVPAMKTLAEMSDDDIRKKVLGQKYVRRPSPPAKRTPTAPVQTAIPV